MPSLIKSAADQHLGARVALLYRLSGQDILGVAVAAILLAFALWGIASDTLLVGWLVWVTLVSVVRKMLAALYKRSAPPEAEAARWESLFCAAATVLGASWGGALLLVFSGRSQLHELALTAVVGLLAMGSPSTLAPSARAFACFSLPILVPLIALMLSRGSNTSTSIGLLLLLSTAVVLSLYVSAHRVLLDMLNGSSESAALNQKIRESETANEAARNRLDLAVQTSGIATWEYDQERGTVYLDRAWSGIVGGKSAEQYLSLDALHAAIHPEDAERVIQAERAMLMGSTNDYVAEYRVQAADGSWKWVLSRGRALGRDARAYAVRAAGTSIDITKQKESEVGLRSSLEKEREQGAAMARAVEEKLLTALQRERDLAESKARLLAISAQEIRTPLAGILVAAETLQDHIVTLGPSERKHIVHSLVENAKHLREVIDQVLGDSKP